jgi:GT2 family glycosyltransferase
MAQMHTVLMIELSVILVHYRTPDLLANCLKSIYTHAGSLAMEIIVVDNSPEWDDMEQLRDAFKEVNWVRADYNLGFARANNLGLNRASGRYFMLLNPDTEISSNTFSALIQTHREKSKNYNVGLVTCRIHALNDKSLLVGSGRNFPDLTKIIRQHPIWIILFRTNNNKKNYAPESMHYETHEVDFASGAVMLGERVKFVLPDFKLDEDFFLYWEDTEWCYRLQRKGLHHFFCGGTQIQHVNAASASTFSNLAAQLYVSEILYFYKRLSIPQFYIYRLMVKNTLFVNFLLAKNHQEKARISEQRILFSKIIRMVNKSYQRKVSSGNEYLRYDSELLSK